MRHSALGDSVAAEMGKILSNDNFKSVFQAPGEQAINEFESVVNQESSYKAFTRIASNKSGDKALAFKHIVETIESISAALDNMGLEKSSTVALSLLNGMIKEAQNGNFGQDPITEEMRERVKSGFGDESDLPVIPSKPEKLPVEMQPHVDTDPFKTPRPDALSANDKGKCCKECKCDPCDCKDDDECMAADGPLSFPKDPSKEGPKPAVNPFDNTSKEPTVRDGRDAKPVIVMHSKEASKITDKKVIALFNSVNSWLK